MYTCPAQHGTIVICIDTTLYSSYITLARAGAAWSTCSDTEWIQSGVLIMHILILIHHSMSHAVLVGLGRNVHNKIETTTI